jgi:hypothetical protein
MCRSAYDVIWPTATALATVFRDAGKAPVTRRSGKREFVVAHRLACNRHLCDVVQRWAFCSLNISG